ncbi:universal stress protein [Thalassospira tepidiphila]|uniref:Universal stress protein UspA n=2 Tax=Thalassospira tepidiphila TaxID=393657 RepID=A0A853KZ95_9PROT|nr:universal stress protein [Thalassospira tepidiphila]NJB76642.1 nucleotide-binding universal stress UspA family protein [Thalassospira tepidiphila]OAZ09966.1 universal stress protein UspA [Thalassospira tepidiphila MCCC 1A03514]
MYQKILVPVDLAHVEKLDKAIKTAVDLAKHYKAEISLLGVGTNTPSSVAHTPKEFEQKLQAFAEDLASKHGVSTKAVAHISHDPAVDLSKELVAKADELGADVIVMASHVPGIADHIFASHGGYVASHSDLSVFLVR